MRVFVTGASGWVGSVVTQELLHHGHSVLGMARSDASAAAIEAAGAQALRGDVEDLDSLIRGAQAADGVIHTAFIHDFSKFVENCEIDRRAITAMAGVLAHTGKPFVITSGTALLSGVALARETMRTDQAVHPLPRIISEQAAEAAAASGANVSVVRLPPSVHGAGDQGFMRILINIARDKGRAGYSGSGANVWPAVHRNDAARLYRLALERNASDARYHAVGDSGVPFRDIAAAIGRGLGLPAVSLPDDELADYFGWFSHFAGFDNPTSSAWTRETLGWAPTQPGLLADLDSGVYFA